MAGSATTGAGIGGGGVGAVVGGGGVGAVVGGSNPIQGAVVGGRAGAVYADRNNDGCVNGYTRGGRCYNGTPPAGGYE